MPMDDDLGRGQTSTGYQGQGRGSGVTDARPSPGGGNTGGSGNAGGGGNRDRQNDSGSDSGSGSSAKQTAKENERRQAEANQRAADDARAKATQDAVDRDRIQAALAEGMRQSELQRIAAGIASLRGVSLPKVQTAEFTSPSSQTDAIADQNVFPVAPTTTMDFKRANEILTSSQGGQYDPTSGGMIPNADMLKGYIKLAGTAGDQTTTRNSMLEGFSKDYLTKMLGSLAKTPGDVSIGSARRSPEEQANIISDRLREIDPKVATDWDKSVSEKGAIAAGQEFKDLFDIAGYFKTPGTQVAMPGSSQHQKSAAMDIAFGGDGAAREDLINKFQTTATGQGLSFPVRGEYWHAELAGDRPTQVASLGETIVSAGKSVVDAITNAPGNTLKALNEAFDSTPQIKALEDQNRLAGGLTKQEYADQFAGGDSTKVQSRIVDYGQGQQVDYYTKSLGDKFGEAASDLGKSISNAGKGITSLFGGETSTAMQPIVTDPFAPTGFGPGGDLTKEQYNEQYGGSDIATNLPPTGTSKTPKTPVVPPVAPTEPVMPTVPNFATAQQYIGTPTVATPGFNFSMPFAPRPQVDFANLGQAYAPTALPSAPPSQPLPGIPGAMYSTPYQRLG